MEGRGGDTNGLKTQLAAVQTPKDREAERARVRQQKSERVRRRNCVKMIKIEGRGVGRGVAGRW